MIYFNLFLKNEQDYEVYLNKHIYTGILILLIYNKIEFKYREYVKFTLIQLN